MTSIQYVVVSTGYDHRITYAIEGGIEDNQKVIREEFTYLSETYQPVFLPAIDPHGDDMSFILNEDLFEEFIELLNMDTL